MNAFWGIIVSNAIVATGLAIGALLLGRVWKHPAAIHGLWLVVLLKLLTPPLITAELPRAFAFPPPEASVPAEIRLRPGTPRGAGPRSSDQQVRPEMRGGQSA